MKRKGRLKRAAKLFVSVILVFVAAACVFRRLPETFGNREAVLAAAAFTLTDGKYPIESGTAPQTTSAVQETVSTTAAGTVPPATSAQNKEKPKQRDKSGYYDTDADHSGEEVYDIAEKTIAGSGTAVDSCYIKNYAGMSLDFEGILSAPLSFQVKKWVSL